MLLYQPVSEGVQEKKIIGSEEKTWVVTITFYLNLSVNLFK